jgi:methylmalonyl-CoA mutase
MLLEESSLARVADPAAGSGALVALTEQLCLTAWAQFQDIEGAGGMWRMLESGVIQKDVAAVRAARERAMAHGKDFLTGTNAFVDIAQASPAVLDVKPHVAAKEQSAAVMATPLPRFRLAEPFEALREKSDKIRAATGTRPKVFLATLGAPADFTVPENFAKNFFETGGIETVSGASADYQAAQASIACLCAAEKTPDIQLAAAAAALKARGARHVYFAGRPGAREALLRESGVQSFIAEGCDALATLQGAYDILHGPER